jgi:hypothetical protein
MAFFDLFKNTARAVFTTDFYLKNALSYGFFKNDPAGSLHFEIPPEK